MIYLNSAGTSWPKPDVVREAIAEAQTAAPEHWGRSFDEQHARVAKALGLTDPSRLLLTPGATSALSVGIADHDWQAGDVVLISGFEHHALHRPAQLLSRQGVELAIAPCREDSPVCLDAVERTLRGGRVRLVAMTAACNVTGDLLPIREIAELAHRYGALFLVDAAQTAGWLPLDLAEFDVDLLAFAGHKGPHSPWGIGGLYVASGIALHSPNASCEIDTGPCRTMPGYCDVGSVDRTALAGLAAGFAWMAGEVERGALDVARRRIAELEGVLAEAPGAVLHRLGGPEQRVPSLAFTIAGRPLSELARTLENAGLVASVGLQCAPLAHQTLGTAPDGTARLSLGPSLSDDTFAEATSRLGAALGL